MKTKTSPSAGTGPALGTPKTSGHYPEPWLIVVLHLGGLYRFLLGRPMDNVIRTNSTFRHSATAGYPSRWLRLAGWHRAAVRVLGLYFLAWVLVIGTGVLIGWTAGKLELDPPAWVRTFTWTRVVLWHLGVLVLVLGPVLVRRLVLDYGLKVQVPVLEVQRVQRLVPARVHLAGWVPWEVQGRKTWERTYVRPLAIAADGVLGTTHRADRAREWVVVPRDFRNQGGQPVEILLPATFTGADEGVKKRLVGTVSARLGMRDPAVEWHLAGNAPRVLLSAPPKPPTLITWAEARDIFMRTEEYRPFLGQAAGSSWLQAEMINDSPHIGLSAGSGAGKSELVKAIIMQALRWGWGVIILDWKEVSHEWADGLPGVRIYRDVADIHDALVSLGGPDGELDDRKRAYRGDRSLPGRAKVLVVYEEMNATSDLLTAYWQDLRATAEPEERKIMPVKSPAVRAQNALVFGGRQFGLFCLFIAQKFSNRVTQGNTDVRENFAIKLMARYSVSAVKMLAPDIKPFPKKPTNLGGWVAVMGDQAVTFQGVLITTEEAREYAMGGEPNPTEPLTRSYYPGLEGQRGNTASALDDQLPRGATGGSQQLALEGAVIPPAEPRKLSDMVDALDHLGITLKILQKAAGDADSGFPPVLGGTPNRGYTYDLHRVTEWARRRHATACAARETR